MSQRNKIQRLLRKGALATCLSLSVVCSSLSAVTAYAGPADDPAAAAPVIGPGGPGTTTDNAAAGTDTNANAGQQADNSYYNQTLSNPVVNPVDKYSYSQMINDISALASRYPGTVTVKSIGKSADGRDIYDVIVGNPNASKKILFQGAIHAREYIVVPLMMQQLEYLAAGFTNNGTYMTQPLRKSYMDKEQEKEGAAVK